MGVPRTKKTHSHIGFIGRPCPTCKRGQPRVFPSKVWVAWVKSARLYVAQPSGGYSPMAAAVDHLAPAAAATRRVLLPDQAYNVAALFYRDRNVGDAVGFYQGLADLLAERGVISDDKWLVTWDGSRLLKDADRPRVELVLSVIG